MAPTIQVGDTRPNSPTTGPCPCAMRAAHAQQQRSQRRHGLSPHKHCANHVLCAHCLQQANPKQGLPLGHPQLSIAAGTGEGSPEPDVGVRSGALPGADPVRVSLLGTTRPGGSFVRERRLFTGRSPGACSCQLRGAEPGVQGPPASRDTASSNAETQHRALEELTMKTKTARTGDVSLPVT